jgi:hypothetical protein
MKDASTPENTEFILYDILSGSRSKPLARVEYQDDQGDWRQFSDIKSVSITKSNQTRVYGRFTTVPPANSAECEIDNRAEKYSPDTGGEFDGVLIRSRRVRLKVGYALPTSSNEQYSHDLADYKTLYHSKVESNKIYNNITLTDAFVNLPGITDDWVFYGSGVYGSTTYQPEGYYLSKVLDFFTFDVETLKTLTLTASGAGMLLYYRASDSFDKLDNNIKIFTLLDGTAAGSNSFTLPNIKERWFQFAVVFQTGLWGVGYVENININYELFAEYFEQGEYLLDDPGFRSVNSDYTANFTARDDLKKALETEVTLPDYSAGVDVAQIIRDTADRCIIPYDSTSIEDTGYNVVIAPADNYQNEKALEVLSDCINYLNSKVVGYRIDMQDGLLRLYIYQSNPTAVDWQIDYRYHGITLDKKFKANQILQRVTCLSRDHITDTESLLKSETLTNQTDYVMSWLKDAMYLRFDTSGSGELSVTSVDLELKQAVVTVAGTLTVSIFGCQLREGFDVGSMSARISRFNTTSYKINDLPPNSVITSIEVQVSEAFNSDGTDLIQIGDVSTAARFAANVDVSATGQRTVTRTAGSFGVIDQVNGVGIYAIYQAGGTAPTEGEAFIKIDYVMLARYKGEALYYDNAKTGDGMTHKIINRLCQDDDECKDLAEGIIAQYGAPKYEIKVRIPANPLIEVGDNVLMWERYSNTRNIFRIDEINTMYQSAGASMYQHLILTDTGAAFSSFDWDDGGDWDVGDLWDQDLAVNVTSDPNTYPQPIML